ncbi:hypothetical protein A4R26_26405 [Niastella populi]|uniref:Uncharacterized protein n=1 Tax=Niastella populi TaxID=550983 RepID=A0A1V9FDI4_9BACT|nr:hypothetical protein A4R26_26405 [Niastella populi]
MTEAVIASVKELRPVKMLLRSILFPILILMGSFDSSALSEETEIDTEESYTYAEGMVKRKSGRYFKLAC